MLNISESCGIPKEIVILSDPSFKDDIARFTMVPFNALSGQYESYYHVYNLET